MVDSNIEIQETYPRKIGGWLLLYLIVMFGSTALYAWGTINGLFGFSELMKGKEGLDLITTVSLFIGTILKLFFSILILTMFISKKSAALKSIILFECFCILVRIIGIVSVIISYHVFPASYFVSLFFIGVSMIWIVYFFRSTRIKETFIN